MPRSSTKTTDATAEDGLGWALPPVRSWFLETFGAPTPAQRGGWPSIAEGRHTLICAPTGTGKTLAAFLACLDAAWRGDDGSGTRVLYVSPLKALNRDIAVNLEAPLTGIFEAVERSGAPLRPLSVGVRTGDTSPADRRAQARRPPEILITTPESLHLLLSSKAREGLRGVSHVIIDEIHDLCSSKRGVSLSLLLERLELLRPAGFVRIGLSATVRPLDEVARYLGGWEGDGPRPVSIVDAGVSKRIELGVSAAKADRGGPSAGGASLEARILDLVRSNRSTIIFSNNRAEVERLTVGLNRRAATRGEPAVEPVRSHHGSLSLERRKETEEALKRGELSAVVATASLELGIDVGAIDHVCQVGSPGSVARGLQRVGRAGHSAGLASRATFFARDEGELLDLAALAGAIRDGDVEPVRIPRNCLDVLAQQVVAVVAEGPIDAARLFSVVRRADCFRALPVEHFEAVLAMLSGRSALVDVRDLRPRIRWDVRSNLLEPLPGTQRFALMGGGTIPDSGRLPVLLEGGPRLGEFDEDFVMERRVGDAVLLGTSTWVIRSIDSRRVVVAPAEGASAVLPFWRGEGLGRSATLGVRVGRLRREIAGRLDDPTLPCWLLDRGSVDPADVPALIESIARQVRAAGVVPDDRTTLVESFLDQAGIRNVAWLTPMGSRFHLGLRLMLQGGMRARLGMAVAGQHGDDGVLLQLPGIDEPPLDLLRQLDPVDCDRLLLVELRESALFNLRFRQVAARALASVGAASGARTPLWLQRIRAEELLGDLKGEPDHPLILETVRECLRDDLDLDGLRAYVGAVRDGSITVHRDASADSPSPMAASLARLFSDRHAGRVSGRPRRGGSRKGAVDASSGGMRPDRPAVDLSPVQIDPDAVHRVDARLRGGGRPPRSPEEMAELLRFCGDLTPEEVSGAMGAFLVELERRGVAGRLRLPGVPEPDRWISTEARPIYEAAFESGGVQGSRDEAADRVILQFLRSRALVRLDELGARYGIDRARARTILERYASAGEVVSVPGTSGRDEGRWGDRRNVEDVRRLSVALRRKEAVAVDPDAFADLLVRHQHVHPGALLGGRDGLEAVLRQLRGLAVPPELWEAEVLPRRLSDFSPTRLDELLRTEQWRWRRVKEEAEPPRVAIVPQDFDRFWATSGGQPGPSDEATRLLDEIRASGLIETEELADRSGLDPVAVGRALAELADRGMIGGDHFDPIRASAPDPRKARSASASSRKAPARATGRRGRADRPWWGTSGVRWSAFAPPEIEGEAMAWARAMLDRFGVLCRETAGLDPWAPPWSVLRTALDAAELRGEVRRGYFVSGLSGVQFALESFAERLARHRPGEGEPGVVLLSTLDPANLFGTGGPFDLPGPSGGTPRMSRSASNHVVLSRGRPVLFAEGFAKRIRVMPWADDRERSAAVATLPGLAGPSRRVLEVREIDGGPALRHPLSGRFLEAGFVRDLHGLAYYAGW
ncbi:DEAD/DEAH box helicase [Tautonia plasticadhaerens]|uniref:ATP-dependent RNA helicase DbpA n=1 Tax=Tautonia plasticadhaerens TaxID=2527974 RepID=A0A518GYM9_9BACT|nr:DEAD/DEAH box helicase [Tautonia plasticadhaerens]QDV33677.1 ATP-dependent RNA helicase DbpA [Tautonia plasticadhaerens]